MQSRARGRKEGGERSGIDDRGGWRRRQRDKLCLFLFTYPFLCLFFTDVRLSVSLCLSLSGSVSLSPLSSISLFLSVSLSPCSSLSLPLSPSLSHPAPLSVSLSPFPPSLHLSLAAGFSQPWPISIYISGYTSGTVHCATITCTGSSGDHHSRPPSFLLLSNQLALNLLPSTFIFAANYPCIFQ